jgi:hypothetical protein
MWEFMLAKNSQRQLGNVSLFLWLNYAEPVQTLGKSGCVEP